MKLFVICLFWGAIPGDIQAIFLALCSRISPAGTWKTSCSVSDQICVGHVQGKFLKFSTYCTMSLFLGWYFLRLYYTCWVDVEFCGAKRLKNVLCHYIQDITPGTYKYYCIWPKAILLLFKIKLRILVWLYYPCLKCSWKK